MTTKKQNKKRKEKEKKVAVSLMATGNTARVNVNRDHRPTMNPTQCAPFTFGAPPLDFVLKIGHDTKSPKQKTNLLLKTVYLPPDTASQNRLVRRLQSYLDFLN
jgi:spore germination protein YaaH